MANILSLEASHTKQIIEDVIAGSGENYITNAYLVYDALDGTFAKTIAEIATKYKITPVANVIVSEFQQLVSLEYIDSLGSILQYNRIYLTNSDDVIKYSMACEEKNVSEIVDSFQFKLADTTSIVVN